MAVQPPDQLNLHDTMMALILLSFQEDNCVDITIRQQLMR